jgi:hypothetical protein
MNSFQKLINSIFRNVFDPFSELCRNISSTDKFKCSLFCKTVTFVFCPLELSKSAFNGKQLLSGLTAADETWNSSHFSSLAMNSFSKAT